MSGPILPGHGFRSALDESGWRLAVVLKLLLRAAIQVPGITLTVLAAAFSIAFPLLVPDLQKGLALPVPIGLAICAVGFTFLTILSGLIALRTAEPELYARLVVAGRPAPEVLSVIAWHARRACRRTIKVGRPDQDCRLLGRFILKLNTALLRIEAMKLLVSKELDIPQRRLCDHLFQYSPVMHRDRLQKYLEHHQKLQGSSSVDTASEAALRAQRAFITNTWRRIRYQNQLLAYRDLHPFIVQFASMHSSSGSLQSYAEALRVVAEKGIDSLRRAGGDDAERRTALREIEDRFRFLYRKQRAHPGFDLHTLLLRAVNRLPSGAGSARTEDILRLIKHTRRSRAVEDRTPDPRIDAIESSLELFSSLPLEIARMVKLSRLGIAKIFGKVYGEWFTESPKGGGRYVVSHGYSRTVLAVLKETLRVEAEAGGQAPRLFFLLEDEKEGFDTRVMEYELKEDEGHRQFDSMAAGSVKHLLRLLLPGDVVLVLLGAECFDDDLRMVHPRGFGLGLAGLVSELEDLQNRSLVVVVAERYKHQKGSLNEDTRFYGQHFDRIDLYPKGMIHLVLTDAEHNLEEGESWPEDRGPVLKRRRSGMRRLRAAARARIVRP